MDRIFELYVKSKLRLKEAGFNLRKFVTNSEELRERIDKNERSASRSEEVQPNVIRLPRHHQKMYTKLKRRT